VPWVDWHGAAAAEMHKGCGAAAAMLMVQLLRCIRGVVLMLLLLAAAEMHKGCGAVAAMLMLQLLRRMGAVAAAAAGVHQGCGAKAGQCHGVAVQPLHFDVFLPTSSRNLKVSTFQLRHSPFLLGLF